MKRFISLLCSILIIITSSSLSICAKISNYDLNEDNEINAKDLIEIKKILLLNINNSFADINNDKTINVLDYVLYVKNFVTYKYDDIPSNFGNQDIENNIFLDSLIYTGYNIEKHRSDGLMWVYVLSSQKKAKGWLSGIEYGSGCTGYETNSQGLPNIERFKQRKKSLLPASFVTYVYFNYLPNVVGADVSSLAKPTDPKLTDSWYLAAKKWVDAGQSEFVEYNAIDNGIKSDIIFTSDIPIGSVICFQDYYKRNGKCSHVAIYAGYANGYHWIFHVFTDNGPEFSAIERINRDPDPQWPLAIISTPKNLRQISN